MLKIVQVAVFIFSAQVGSGLFLLPSALCGVGYKALLIFTLVGLLCTLIIKIFAETGENSHEIIGTAFGAKVGNLFFFIYWFISWFSTVVLFKELVGYLGLPPFQGLGIEVIIWFFVTFFNMWSLKRMMLLESLLTALKVLPFFGLCVCYFLTAKTSHITPLSPVSFPLVLRCLWNFVGLETGNIIAKNLDISKKEREIGTYLGMATVIIFYVLSLFFCFSIGGTELLWGNKAPYIDIFQKCLGAYMAPNTISYFIKSLVSITLVGSINSWTISTGYMGCEGGELKVLPKCFTYKNKHQVPHISIFLSSLCVLFFIILCCNQNIYATTVKLIEISSCFFLFIYGMCIWAYSSIYLKGIKKILYNMLAAIIIFCFISEIYKNILLIVF